MNDVSATGNIVNLKTEFAQNATPPHKQIENAVNFLDQVRNMTAAGNPLSEEVFRTGAQIHTELHNRTVLYEHAAAYQAGGMHCPNEMETYLNSVGSTLKQVDHILSTLSRFKQDIAKA